MIFMAEWKVTYRDGTRDYFEADTYDSGSGAFRNEVRTVGYVNVAEVKSVRRVEDNAKEEARGALSLGAR